MCFEGDRRVGKKKGRFVSAPSVIECLRSSASSFDGNVVPESRAGIKLTRPPDFLIGVFDHFVPLRDPADGAGNRK